MGNFWADIEWDPTTNTFRVANAGRDEVPQLEVTLATYTVAENSAPNLTQACTQEFGPASRQADWQDIKALLCSDNLALQAFIEGNGMVPGDRYLVTYGKRIFNDYGWPYAMVTKNGDLSDVEERLGGDTLIVGSYSFQMTGWVVCINPQALDFPD
ncbi:MAG TPA: hypothetical protein ENI90_09870 [Methylothermaceae bacterium]|nr:hypothetical protein [Methylothermaceae bacterium]